MVDRGNNDWLQPPSEDEPDSFQDLQESELYYEADRRPVLDRMDPELERILEEEEEIERAARETAHVLNSDELAEIGAESLGPQNLQSVIGVLGEYLQHYAGSDRAGFYNALRVLAEATGSYLPVTVIRDIALVSPEHLIRHVGEIAENYADRKPGQSIPIFGPVAWEPPTLMHCRLIDGTEFLCFNQPSRDPAPDRPI